MDNTRCSHYRPQIKYWQKYMCAIKPEGTRPKAASSSSPEKYQNNSTINYKLSYTEL